MTGELELSCFGMIASTVPEMSAPPARSARLSHIQTECNRRGRSSLSGIGENLHRQQRQGVDLKRVSTSNGKQRAELER
jgi:hypothetical protein